MLPLEAPLTLFVWSKQRVVPVRVTDLSITEEAFDVALNPIRAKVSLGLRVLSVDDLGFEHRGGTLFMAYLRNKEALAGRAASVALSQLGDRVGSDARSAARAARGGRRPDDDVPADEPLRGRRRRRLGSGRREAAGAVPAPAVLPAPGALRAALRGRASSRATGATCSRTAHLGDAELWWRLADANGVVDPRDLDVAGRPAPAHHAPGGRAGAEMPEPVRLQLLIGPGVPVPAPREVIDAVQARDRRVELGRDAERLRAHAHDLEPLAAADALPAHRRLEHPDLPRRHRGHVQAARRRC